MGGGLAPAIEVVAYLFANVQADAATLESLAATYDVSAEVLEPYINEAVDQGVLEETGEWYELTPDGQKAAEIRGAAEVSDRTIELVVDEIAAD